MKHKTMSSTQVLAIGFLCLILLGAFLLHLPIASRDGQRIPLLNAIFTSASATCVTGLIVYDTATQFTVFGQAVILLLIQVGGLGFMTALIAALTLTHRQISLRQRTVLGESVGITRLSGVVRLSRRILLGTLFSEGLGALLLAVRFIPRLGVRRGVWYAVFHSISAFCNAGFDLMGPYSPGGSLTGYADDPVVLLTIACLILTGGIGFIVWNDLVDALKEKRKLCLHTRVTLGATLVLVAGGTVVLFLTERAGVLSGMSLGEQLLNALFHAVTPRTAGFNSVPTAALSDSGKLVTMLLMLIGAAPGGTGGGVKITTFVVVVLSVRASLRGQKDATVGRFRLEGEVVKQAFSSMALYCSMALFGMFVLCFQHIGLSDAAFECLSAIGTVGLSTGVTSALAPLSKIMIVVLMYAGRVGSFTVFLAVSGEKRASKLVNPIGKIIVG